MSSDHQSRLYNFANAIVPYFSKMTPSPPNGKNERCIVFFYFDPRQEIPPKEKERAAKHRAPVGGK
jgi:hypothetical protein